LELGNLSKAVAAGEIAQVWQWEQQGKHGSSKRRVDGIIIMFLEEARA